MTKRTIVRWESMESWRKVDRLAWHGYVALLKKRELDNARRREKRKA